MPRCNFQNELLLLLGPSRELQMFELLMEKKALSSLENNCCSKFPPSAPPSSQHFIYSLPPSLLSSCCCVSWGGISFGIPTACKACPGSIWTGRFRELGCSSPVAHTFPDSLRGILPLPFFRAATKYILDFIASIEGWNTEKGLKKCWDPGRDYGN